MNKFVSIIFCILFVSFAQAQDDVFTVVEEMPIFTQQCFEKTTNDEQVKCSNLAIQQYISKVYYPQTALEENIQGKVYVSFVVDTLGRVGDVKLLRGVHKLLDNEALYQVKNMSAFYKPGYQNGNPVKVKFTVPVVFKIVIPTEEEIKKYRKELLGN